MVARPMPKTFSHAGGHAIDSDGVQQIFPICYPMQGCYMESHDSTTLFTQKRTCVNKPLVHLFIEVSAQSYATVLSTSTPCVIQIVRTYHISCTGVPRFTLVVVTCVNPWLVHLSIDVSANCTLPHHLYVCTTYIISSHMVLYGLYNHQILHVLAKWTDCDILVIQHPFDPI